MESLFTIVDGFKRLAMGQNKELGKKRAAICDECPYKTELNTCSKCGCFLPAKVVAKKASCPINKW